MSEEFEKNDDLSFLDHYEFLFPCPCCGMMTLHEKPPGTFEVCSACGWEDDAAQARDPELEGGANVDSLIAHRKAFFATDTNEGEQNV